MPRSCKALLVPALALLAGACSSAHVDQIAQGQDIYTRVCSSCHPAIAPNITNVLGRKVASVADYDYSEALAKDPGSWTPDKLRSYLMGPLQMYPEGRMVITPLTAEEADAVVAYLDSIESS